MAPRSPAALFDYDYTLIGTESLRLFMAYIIKTYPRALVRIPRMVLHGVPYSLNLLGKERMKTEALRIMRHVPAEERQALLARFAGDILGPRHHPGGLERIAWHRKRGHRLILVSASVETYLGAVQELLGFDDLICTRTDAADRVVGANCWGREKVNRLRQLASFDRIDWENSWAYSDHLSDLPMLLLCRHKVATNPKPALRRRARAEGWEIVDW